jgi:predicted dehydrogenase
VIPELFAGVARDCEIIVPAEHRRPIAIVGAGAIVNAAHLPAYTAGGLEVVGIYDHHPGRARETADRHGVPKVFDSFEDLLADERVEVVDVAVTAAAQPDILRQVLRSGRHALAQKPFAPDAATAAELADLADAEGRVLVVNQQLRYDEGMTTAHRMIELGWIGEVTAMSIDVNIWTEWTSWPWMLEVSRLEVMVHSIHYLDVVRWFLGDPELVFTVAGRTPGQAPAGETRTATTMVHAGGRIATIHANHENASGDNAALFRIDGSHGSIRGTLGLLYDYPSGRPDTLEIWSTVLGTDGWVPYPITKRWAPDAFLGPMAGLLAAAASGETPRTSARDNVGTIGLIEHVYRSLEGGVAVRPST